MQVAFHQGVQGYNEMAFTRDLLRILSSVASHAWFTCNTGYAVAKYEKRGNLL